MSRTSRFMAHGAFFRAEARATGERWRVKVFRNGSFIVDAEGPPHALDDRALATAFESVRFLAEQRMWEPDATRVSVECTQTTIGAKMDRATKLARIEGIRAGALLAIKKQGKWERVGA